MYKELAGWNDQDSITLNRPEVDLRQFETDEFKAKSADGQKNAPWYKKERLIVQHRLLIFVGGARPEGAFQPILFVARHQVNMQVRHTLADTVVDRHKRLFCLQAPFNDTFDPLGVLEQGRHKRCGRVRQSLHMELRHEQRPSIPSRV